MTSWYLETSWHALVVKIVRANARKYAYSKIPAQDWRQLEAEIITHVYTKRALYDAAKPLVNWIAVVTSNKIVNFVRNCNAKKRRRKACSFDVLMSCGFENQFLGKLDKTHTATQEFISRLNQEDIEMLTSLYEGERASQLGARLGLHRRSIWCRLQKIKGKYKEFLNE